MIAKKNNRLGKTRISEPLNHTPLYMPSELAQQRARVANGPFKSNGDYKTNSPGEYDYGLTQVAAGSIMADFWECFPAFVSQAIPTTNGYDPGLPENNIKFLYHAAQYKLTKNRAMGGNCRTFFLATVRSWANDFGNLTRFPAGVWGDGAPVKDVAAVGLRWLYLYLYTYDLYTLSEHQEAQEFFFKMGIYWKDRNINHRALANNYNTRAWDNWVIKPSLNTTELLGRTHYNGNPVHRPANFYNNRLEAPNELVCAIGTMLTFFGHRIRPSSVALSTTAEVNTKISEMLADSELYHREILVFATYPDHLLMDASRGAEDARDMPIEADGGDPAQPPVRPFLSDQYESGFGYECIILASILRAEMMKRRAGLPHLLDFSTNLVFNNVTKLVTAQTGVSKSFKNSVIKLIDLYTGIAPVIHSRNSNTNPALGSESEMNGRVEANGKNYFRHVGGWFSEPNLHWKDTYIDDFAKANLAGLSFPTDANAMSSGVGRSQGGPHLQWDFSYFNHLIISPF
jgi:hypothetical protein